MTDVETVWAAADLTGLSTSTSALLVAFIGVGLLFVAYRYIKKGGIR